MDLHPGLLPPTHRYSRIGSISHMYHAETNKHHTRNDRLSPASFRSMPEQPHIITHDGDNEERTRSMWSTSSASTPASESEITECNIHHRMSPAPLEVVSAYVSRSYDADDTPPPQDGDSTRSSPPRRRAHPLIHHFYRADSLSRKSSIDSLDLERRRAWRERKKDAKQARFNRRLRTRETWKKQYGKLRKRIRILGLRKRSGAQDREQGRIQCDDLPRHAFTIPPSQGSVSNGLPTYEGLRPGNRKDKLRATTLGLVPEDNTEDAPPKYISRG
ncbi:hypothetical protein PMIN02_006907 [Paraphaeosphaeria minitans]